MKKLFLLILMSLLLFVGGCNTLKNMINKNNNITEEESVRVQDYNGEGYTIRGGRAEAAEIAEEHREEVEEAVKEYFLKNYHTEVKVHQFIGAQDAISVTVEAVGEPFFYTFAIVPVDINSKTVLIDQVWALEGEVQQGFLSGFYAMAYEELFRNLDNYIETLIEEFPIIGMNIEALQNTNIIIGYAKPNYFVNVGGETFLQLFDHYMENPNLNKEDILMFFKENEVNPDHINISMDFFMIDEGVEPDRKILEQIAEDIKKMSNIPKGKYSIFINDNYVVEDKGTGRKITSIAITAPNRIIKE